MPPTSGDAGEHAVRLKTQVLLAVPLVIISTAAGFKVVGASLLLLLFPLGGLVGAIVIAEAILATGDRVGRIAGRLLEGATGVPYEHTYSAEEAMVAQGRFEAAARAYRADLAADPDRLVPLARLADLMLRHLDDPAEAERLFLEYRKRSGDPLAMSNHLIDLYRTSGNRGRLMAELSRLSAHSPGSPAGQTARKELQSLKEDLESA
jgi:hypothetical protein